MAHSLSYRLVVRAESAAYKSMAVALWARQVWRGKPPFDLRRALLMIEVAKRLSLKLPTQDSLRTARRFAHAHRSWREQLGV